MRSSALLALWFAFGSCHVFAATQAETDELYKRAIAAIDNKDCASGAVLLRRYKIDAAESLKSKPIFSLTIDTQIADCEMTVLTGTETWKASSIPGRKGTARPPSPETRKASGTPGFKGTAKPRPSD
jgi:hypothetical protein